VHASSLVDKVQLASLALVQPVVLIAPIISPFNNTASADSELSCDALKAGSLIELPTLKTTPCQHALSSVYYIAW